MRHETLLALTKYNAYANRIVLEAAAQLSEVDLVCPSSPSHESVQGLLLHILGAEAFFLSVCQQRPLDDVHLYTLADIRRYWDGVSQEMRKFVASLSEQEHARVIAADIGGHTFYLPIWQLLSQAIMHSTHHRGELSVVLTELGHPLPTLDIIVQFAEESGQPWPQK
jgi:uncharacterized damage-inducible protein DinB